VEKADAVAQGVRPDHRAAQQLRTGRDRGDRALTVEVA
jgi:hypothetical protein